MCEEENLIPYIKALFKLTNAIACAVLAPLSCSGCTASSGVSGGYSLKAKPNKCFMLVHLPVTYLHPEILKEFCSAIKLNISCSYHWAS